MGVSRNVPDQNLVKKGGRGWLAKVHQRQGCHRGTSSYHAAGIVPRDLSSRSLVELKTIPTASSIFCNITCMHMEYGHLHSYKLLINNTICNSVPSLTSLVAWLAQQYYGRYSETCFPFQLPMHNIFWSLNLSHWLNITVDIQYIRSVSHDTHKDNKLRMFSSEELRICIKHIALKRIS